MYGMWESIQPCSQDGFDHSELFSSSSLHHDQLKLWQEQLRAYRDHITISDSLTHNVFLGLSSTALLCSFLSLCSECEMMMPVHFHMAGCDWVSC